MILEILLLIVWIYLSIAFTLFLTTLGVNDKEIARLKLDTINRDIKLDKILHLVSTMNGKIYTNKKKQWIN